MRGVEAGQVADACEIGRFVDGDDLEGVDQTGFVERAQVAAPDAAVAVDHDAKRGRLIGAGRRGYRGVACSGHDVDSRAWPGGAEVWHPREALILAAGAAASGAGTKKRGGFRRPNPFPWIAQEALQRDTLAHQAFAVFASPLMKKLAR